MGRVSPMAGLKDPRAFVRTYKRVFEKSDLATEAGPCWKTMSGTTRI